MVKYNTILMKKVNTISFRYQTNVCPITQFNDSAWLTLTGQSSILITNA
jgi:hypothetical protein